MFYDRLYFGRPNSMCPKPVYCLPNQLKISRRQQLNVDVINEFRRIFRWYVQIFFYSSQGTAFLTSFGTQWRYIFLEWNAISLSILIRKCSSQRLDSTVVYYFRSIFLILKNQKMTYLNLIWIHYQVNMLLMVGSKNSIDSA